MARSRNIKPGLFDDEVLGEADPIYTVLFTGLWCYADKKGRLEDRPARIRKQILGYRNVDACLALAWLNDNGYIKRYSVDGQNLIEINNWSKHQSPHHKEVDSELPGPECANSAEAKASQKQSDEDDQSKHDSSMDQACANHDSTTPPDSLQLDSLQLDSREPPNPQGGSDLSGSAAVDDPPPDPPADPPISHPPDGVTSVQWARYRDARKSKRHPMTKHNLQLFREALAKTVAESGMPASDLIAKATEAGWRTIKTEWVLSPGAPNGQQPQTNHSGFAGREYAGDEADPEADFGGQADARGSAEISGASTPV